LDPVRFRAGGFGLSIGSANPDDKINRQEGFKIAPIKQAKKTKTTQPNFGLEKLLIETEKRLEKVMEELKKTYLDCLLDEHARLDAFIRQLKRQIAVRQAHGPEQCRRAVRDRR